MAIYDLTTKRTEIVDAPLKRDKSRRVTVKPNFDSSAHLVKTHPGFDPRMIESIVQNGGRGIVLEGTGLGHVPRTCYEPIRKAVKSDVPVFMTSQTIWGRVDMNVYYTGRDLLATGVVPLEDMISETALVKLMWCLAQTQNPEKLTEMMLEPVAGEILSRTPYLESQAER